MDSKYYTVCRISSMRIFSPVVANGCDRGLVFRGERQCARCLAAVTPGQASTCQLVRARACALARERRLHRLWRAAVAAFVLGCFLSVLPALWTDIGEAIDANWAATCQVSVEDFRAARPVSRGERVTFLAPREWRPGDVVLGWDGAPLVYIGQPATVPAPDAPDGPAPAGEPAPADFLAAR